MTNLDRFESLFRSALKEQHEYEDIELTHGVLVTDTNMESTAAIMAEVHHAFPQLQGLSWSTMPDGTYGDASDLMALLGASGTSLVCTYRNLYTRTKQWPYSLGSFVDVLAQVTPMPLLVIPHPAQDGVFEPPLSQVEHVLVITDHMVGSQELVNYGVRLTPQGGTLVLAHIEDDTTFTRYSEIMGRLPEIDTELAVASIKDKLLGEASEYIKTIQTSLAQASSPIASVISEVRMGHRVSDVRALMDKHHIDLVVFAVKDDEQLAMHGLAYPLAIELRDVPVLMV